MKDLSHLVSDVKQKAQKLIDKHQILTNKNANLSNELEKIKQELEIKDQQILELNNKIKLLKIAGSVDSGGTKEVKLKINEMVREIDKCIAQINR
jgi:23S rRNA maturation-related 3'-5' exoribonuclease YhaM